MSGGFDSTSIVVLADEIYLQSNGNLAPLETISAIYGNLLCDESYYIEAVTNRVSFPNNTFNLLDEAFHPDSLSEHLWQLDSPYERIHPAFSNGCGRLMTKIGGRGRLDGTGGDQVAQFNCDLSDLARRGKGLALIRECWAISGKIPNDFLRLVSGAALGATPEVLRRQYRKVRKRKEPALPI
ncbi:MAG: hypothetical protein BMS9Abin02_1932 [Anaerolineae bacterium]|nr:MAG: hypothetical protein BMS9Abin02_1932 [Anaerolineae bacterium]